MPHRASNTPALLLRVLPTEFGEPFGVGDVITAELNPSDGRIRFFKNATPLGTAFVDTALCCELVPARVMLSRDACGPDRPAHPRSVHNPQRAQLHPSARPSASAPTAAERWRVCSC